MTFGKPPPRNPFDDLFADQPDGNALFRLVNALGQQPPPPSQVGDLFRDLASMGQASAAAKALDVSDLIPLHESRPIHSALALARALEQYRRRDEWNARFRHWRKPASDSEEETLARAKNNVREALSSNVWLGNEGVTIAPQGSYFNRTNVRREADIDLRLVHPQTRIEYGPGVATTAAFANLGYAPARRTFDAVLAEMRRQITADLVRHFGSGHVDATGSKAIHIKGVTGSRAMVDVVPCFTMHYVEQVPGWTTYRTTEGVGLLTRDGWIYNFPTQHHDNGNAKRNRTLRRFKGIVRVFKSLRADMEERGIGRVRVPSFLVECLVYAVEDGYFLVEDDDMYGRVRRIAVRMKELLADPVAAGNLREINGVKGLFFAKQAWTYKQAKAFVDDVLTHLGDA